MSAAAKLSTVVSHQSTHQPLNQDPSTHQATKELRSKAYLKHIPLHNPRPLLVLKPPLGPKELRIVPKHRPIPMQHPPIQRKPRAGREVPPLDLDAVRRGGVPRDVEAYRGPQTHGLLETGLEVRQGLRLGPLHVACERDRAGGDGGVHLGAERGVDAGRG